MTSFICKLIKHIHPTAKISKECKDVLDGITTKLCSDYIKACSILCRHADRATINSDSITAITNIWLWDYNHSLLSFANNVWDKYTNDTIKGSKKNVKAGLYLSPVRIKSIFTKYTTNNQVIGETGYIYLTAIVEKILIDIFSNLGDYGKTITSLDIFISINSDQLEYIQKLLHGYFIVGVGVVGDKLLIHNQKEYLTHSIIS